MINKYFESYLLCNVGFLFLFLIGVLYQYIYKENEKVYIAFLISLFLASISSIRYGIGTDYFEYIKEFYLRNSNKIREEFVFTFISKVSWFINKSSISFFVVTSTITNFLIINYYRKYSLFFFFSIFLYISLWYYFMSWNLVRQYVAIAFLFYFSSCINNNKHFRSILIFITCFFIHYSSIIPLFLIYYVKLLGGFKHYVFYLIMPLLLIFINYDFILSNFSFNGVRFTHYLLLLDKVNFTSFIISLIGLLPIIILRIKYKILDFEIDYYIKIVILGSIFLLFSTKNIYLTRVAFYFLIFQTILIPNFSTLIKSKSSRFLYHIFYIFFALISFNLSFLQLRDGVIPFKFISF